MGKQTLYYWAKLYEQQMQEGGEYRDLKKTITINILDFNVVANYQYHNTFHLLEDKTPKADGIVSRLFAGYKKNLPPLFNIYGLRKIQTGRSVDCDDDEHKYDGVSRNYNAAYNIVHLITYSVR